VQNNRAIDFVIVRYIIDSFHTIQINSFDISVGDGISDKKNRA
jgi:hypothetical protein